MRKGGSEREGREFNYSKEEAVTACVVKHLVSNNTHNLSLLPHVICMGLVVCK